MKDEFHALGFKISNSQAIRLEQRIKEIVNMPTKKIKKLKSSQPKRKKLPLVNFKCAKSDQVLLRRLARKYAGGNFSAWLRHAGLKYRPKKGVIIR